MNRIKFPFLIFLILRQMSGKWEKNEIYIEYKTIPLPNQYQLLIQRMKQMKNVIFLCVPSGTEKPY